MSSRRVVAIALIGGMALTSAPRVLTAEDVEQGPSLQEILLIWAADQAGSQRAPELLYGHVRRGLDATFRLPLDRDAKEIRKLAKEDPRIYISVLGLYRWAHSLAVMRRDWRMQQQLYGDLTRLVDEFVERVDEPAAFRIGASILFSAGLTSRNWGDLAIALEAMEDAHDLDPDNPVILHAAAAIYEKKGLYHSARTRLQKVVALGNSDEARLRLALCRMRSGQRKKAVRSLAEIAEGFGEPWLRVVAFQERAKLALAGGDQASAEEIARAGLEAFPHDESLAVLVAFLAGPRDPGARLIVNRLTSRPGEGPGDRTPRGRYNVWPMDTLVGEQRLDRLVADESPVLAGVLSPPAIGKAP